MGLSIIFTGCQTPEPGPTPTPTRTPIIPTATPTVPATPTPTLTPTLTPTPTPTLPPNLVLPPIPQSPSGWPPIPVDLFYLRNGRLNIWLAEGSHSEIPLLSQDNTSAVHSYHISTDGRFVAYVTSSGKLYILDRATWEHTYIPTSGYLVSQDTTAFTLSDDGNLIIYLAWGTQPSTASSPKSSLPSGTLLSIDTRHPKKMQNVLGFCQGVGDKPCVTFTLSPDEQRLAYVDGHGVWLGALDGEKARVITPHVGNITYSKLSWSPDSRWLLIHDNANNIAVYDTSRPELSPVPVQICKGVCDIRVSWAAYTLWFIIDEIHQSCLSEVNPENVRDGQLDIVNTICQVDGWDLQPVALQAFPDNRVFFLNRGCTRPCEGPAPGLYLRHLDNGITPITLLDDIDGTTVWAVDGSAFLFTSKNVTIRRIGVLNSPAYWDVTSQLQGSYAFQWGEPTVTNP